MPMAWLCDGCGGALAMHVAPEGGCPDTCRGCKNGHEGAVIGRLDPCHYCATCEGAWRAHDAAVHAQRVAAIRALETFIRTSEIELKTTLRRLPD